ncbi:MAG TPA: putative toxin, partial [Candidatus Angelobacter sp.]|nr:putative toxin [Candidatus Angelobacter sp.]
WVSADWSPTPVPVPYASFGDPQSLNLYGYVRNIPTTGMDADGHACTVATPQCVAYSWLAGKIEEGIDAIANVMGPSLPHGETPYLENMKQQAPQCPCPSNQKQEDSKQNNNNSQSKNTSDVQANRKAGLDYEKKVLDKEGVSKNTKPMKATDPKTGKEGTTIPDGVRENGQTVESKGGKSVSDSPQLRRQTEVSQQSGQKPQVVVKPGTKVSKTVRERMNVKEQQ